MKMARARPYSAANMLLLWIFFIAASAHKVYDSTEDIGPEAFENITTLYPITHNNTDNTSIDQSAKANLITDTDNNSVGSKETNSKEDKSKLDATVWKLDAAYTESNLEDDEEKKDIAEAKDTKNETKKFKPSPHLGNFFDEDDFVVTPTKSSEESFVPMRKPAGLVSTKDDFRSPFTKIPKHVFETHAQYPYKFESPVLPRLKDPWQHRPDGLESKPTLESPVKIPAGGYYTYEDPFREKPGFTGNGYNEGFQKKPLYQGSSEDPYQASYPSIGYDELFTEKPLYPGDNADPFRDKPGTAGSGEFGLGFTEDGKNGHPALKKRVDPWQHFFQLVTAFLPVGLIISALTPTLVTIENTAPGNNHHTYPGNVFRRSGTVPSPAPALDSISEQCRRRLLCELHSDRYYKADRSTRRRGKHCYKIRCEDPDALNKILLWLLEYRNKNTHKT